MKAVAKATSGTLQSVSQSRDGLRCGGEGCVLVNQKRGRKHLEAFRMDNNNRCFSFRENLVVFALLVAPAP